MGRTAGARARVGALELVGQQRASDVPGLSRPPCSAVAGLCYLAGKHYSRETATSKQRHADQLGAGMRSSTRSGPVFTAPPGLCFTVTDQSVATHQLVAPVELQSLGQSQRCRTAHAGTTKPCTMREPVSTPTAGYSRSVVVQVMSNETKIPASHQLRGSITPFTL